MDDQQLRVQLLGTGTSTGVPVIGCDCEVCTSPDPRDSRLRCSCYIQIGNVSILIDAGPDFRAQALRAHIDSVDAVLITHHHFDHVVGLDDLRPFLFRNKVAIPCYASPETATVLERMFSYIFVDSDYPGVANLDLVRVDAPFHVEGRRELSDRVQVTPIPVLHGDLQIYGYRIGNFAYLTDTSAIPESSMDLLVGVEVLVLDGLRYESHTKHLTIPEAVELARQIGARQTYLVHLAHSIHHKRVDAELPDGVNLGYDGLKFSVRL
ncbi:MAG: MBL fold metallo-hydrolase [Bacteroidetes bacterium]|nr:MAG: MBL fold metallo-hydrolase [Bacteroidota bacterium]